MNRETKTIQTPIGKQNVEIKTYITGKEKRDLTNVFLSGNLDFNAESQNIKGINANLVDKAQDLAFQLIVVSIDGKKDGEIDIVKTILDMQAEDTDFIIKNTSQIQNASSAEKKTI